MKDKKLGSKNKSKSPRKNLRKKNNTDINSIKKITFNQSSSEKKQKNDEPLKSKLTNNKIQFNNRFKDIKIEKEEKIKKTKEFKKKNNINLMMIVEIKALKIKIMKII